MNRRTFIVNTSLATTSFYVPKFINNMGMKDLFINPSGKKLIVIQLSGGNDGLNTIIPYENDIYYNLRPGIAISKKEALRINDQLAFNPAMEMLKPIFDEGEMAIINNVGYPNPDRSHFRSMDIWQSASGSETYIQSGWLGRYLDHSCTGQGDAHKAIEINDKLSLALKGENFNGFVMEDSNALMKSLKNPYTNHEFHDQRNDNLNYLYKVLANTEQSAEYLHEKIKVYQSKKDYPKNQFGKAAKQIAELINSGCNSQIYYLSLSGFDTHVFQNQKQKRLLKIYSETISALIEDLKTNDKMDEVLILTFSEFGRRVKQNASNGTDHGTANNVFIIGKNLKAPGFHSEDINLENLDNGDLKFKVDFRDIYTDILNNWLNVPAHIIISGQFDGLGVV